MKKISMSFLIMLVFLLSFSSYVVAQDLGGPIAVTKPNGQVITVSPRIEQNMVVYGHPADVPNIVIGHLNLHNTQRNGQYRFLGYNRNGEPFFNKLYPNEPGGLNVAPHLKPWDEEPWAPSKRWLLEDEWHFRGDPERLSWFTSMNWPNYTPQMFSDRAYVIARPTATGPGAFVMTYWGGTRYQTFYLLPTGTIDLKAEFEQHEFNVGPNEAIESTVTFSRLDNDDPTGEAVDAFVSLVHRTSGEWPVTLTPINPEDALVKDEADQWTTKFKPGESKTYKYTVTSQTRDTEVVASIGQALADKNEADNVDTALIHVKAPNLVGCEFYLHITR